MALRDSGAFAGRGSLQSQAYHELREMIIQQKLQPGVKVSESDLCLLTGYGRAPIRVALRGLVGDGLVHIVPQSGVYVTRIEPETELKVLEVRSELERLLTTCAARRATHEQLRRMAVIADRLRSEVARHRLRFGMLLRDVHEVLTEAADNQFLTGVMDRIHALSRRFWYAHHEQLRDVDQGASLHADRLNYIVNRDIEAAAAASDAIVEFVKNYVLNILGEKSKLAMSAPTPSKSQGGRELYHVRLITSSLARDGG